MLRRYVDRDPDDSDGLVGLPRPGQASSHDEITRPVVYATLLLTVLCAAFASPRAAVDAAIVAQRKLELPVRMGIATGEAEQ
jgi:hypothetical protein